jgi:hypothetical protein
MALPTARCLYRGSVHIVVGMDSACRRWSLAEFGMEPDGFPVSEVLADPRFDTYRVTLDAVYRDGVVRATPLMAPGGIAGEAVVAPWPFADGSRGLAVTWRAVPALGTPERPSLTPARVA